MDSDVVAGVGKVLSKKSRTICLPSHLWVKFVQQLNGWLQDVIPDTHHYRLLKLLEADPHMSQRELAQAMGVSVGKVNYCLKALVERGFVKLDNFRKNQDKRFYAYLLTPKGLEEKARITVAFLQRKLAEYENITAEIQELRKEAKKAAGQ